MTKTRKILFIGVTFLVVCVLLIRLLFVERSYLIQSDKMENRLKEAEQREEKAVVIRHVSKQMEEIAYQQKDISDKQRKEAELQAAENFRMKLRVEEEWKYAVAAQQEALEAYRLADKQKALAEERQYQAEYAKRVADTLTYLTLGRSLGSFSVTQYKTGNYEIASLLAYSAWHFVKKYRGDIFLSSIFNSLSLSARYSSVWQRHKGGISAIVFPSASQAESAFYTIGKYGEILIWNEDGRGGYRTKPILSEPQYDFRAASVDSNGTLHALCHDGKLLKLSHGQQQMFPLAGMHYTQMMFINEKCLLLSATGSVLFAGEEQPLYSSPDITCMAKLENSVCMGRSNGDIIRTTLSGEETIPVKNYHHSTVTAFGYCSSSKQLAIGYGDGTLLLFDPEQKTYRKLVGHRSTITALALRESKLYSCGYDRTLRLWNLSVERPESVVVLESSSWLHSLAFDPDEDMLFAGDENGNLYRMCVSPDRMAANIKKNLPRNFTREEWAYYMGNQLPFEVYTSKKDDV